MLEQLGKIIEKKPWFVVLLVVLITIGFGILIPSLQFKTNFEDFAPDNEQVKANNRISEYFGMSQQVMFLFVEKQQGKSTITPQALRDQYALQKELSKIPEINETISITTFVDTVCQMEFNKTLEKCSDEQIQVALDDLLNIQNSEEFKILDTDDPNEPVDYNRHPRISKGKSIDSADIKNCYISKDNETITFSIEVYDLLALENKLKPPFQRVNSIEWHVGFENLLIPKELGLEYKIAARIEPTSHFWEVGKGIFGNTKSLINIIRNHELSSYKKEAYMWMKVPGQNIFFPIQLKTGNVTFDTTKNRINIVVSRDEIGNFGIAPRFGSFEIPAKLTNFTVGVKYYQKPLLNRPGGHIVVNTSFLFKHIEKLQSRPIVGKLISRILGKYGMNLNDFSDLSDTMQGTDMLPDKFSLKDLESLWTHADTAPDTGVSKNVFSIIPQFFSDLRVNALSFISKDYEQTKNPKASIIIIQLENSDDLESFYNTITDKITELDSHFQSISIQATGEGIVSAQINKVTMDANTIIAPSIFIIIVCILFLAFRKPSYVVLPILVFAFSCIWLFGTMALLGISFSIIAVALLPLNIGLGVEYSVNILHNYRVELAKGRTPAEAIRLSIKEVGAAIFLAWFTTFVAFLSFLSATLPPVRDFGIFLALGITYTFIISMTFLTSLRYITDRKKKVAKVKAKKKQFYVQNALGSLAQILMKHEKKVFVVTILVCLVMGVGISQLRTGFSMEEFIPQDNPALDLFDKISEDFPYASQDQEYVLVEGNVATLQTLQGLAVTHKNMNDDQYVARKTDGSTKTESIYTIMRQAIINNRSLATAFNIDEKTGFPKSDVDVRGFYDYLYDNDEYEMQVRGVLYKDKNKYTATIIRVYTNIGSNISGDVTKELEIFYEELKDDLASYGGASSIATGSLIITSTILKNMTESQILSTCLCFILAAIMLTLIYRNPVLGLIALIPVTISIIWVLGTMYLVGYSLNILTITVTSITIGVGIDYACYITVRFRLVVDKTEDIAKAVSETISRTGSAIFIAALSSMFGFGVLMFAPIPPQQQFGLITAVTLVYAFSTSILILPLVLARWAKWRRKRIGYIISPGAPRNLDGIDDLSDDD